MNVDDPILSSAVAAPSGPMDEHERASMVAAGRLVPDEETDERWRIGKHRVRRKKSDRSVRGSAEFHASVGDHPTGIFCIHVQYAVFGSHRAA